MLNEFYHQIRRNGIKLDEVDLVKLGEIISSHGDIYITEEFLESIANHLEDFTKQVVDLLGAVK